MSAIRLPFLYPVLFKPIRQSSRGLVDHAAHTAGGALSPVSRATFHTSQRRCGPTPEYQRYGTANEPPPQLKPENRKAKPSGEQAKEEPTLGATDTAAKQPSLGKSRQQQQPKAQQEQKPQQQQQIQPSESSQQAGQQKEQPQTASSEVKFPEEHTAPATDYASLTEPSSSTSTSSPESKWEAQRWNAASQQSPGQNAGPANALSTILNMEPPMADNAAEEKPPHLQAPRYVHHFDTYTLVKKLEEGGFSKDQAVTLMKSVRASLADNMELAREGLLSKADAEMESYLFRAACTELRTELRSTRQSTSDQVRTDRNTLQHDSEILSQRISADTQVLKDELRGMMDDRKMAVRQDRRAMENRIQELNYRITLKLQSEVKSDVEGLRFVMTRRTVFALAVVIVSSLVLLRLVSSAGGIEEAVATKKEKAREKERGEAGAEARGDADGPMGESLG